MCAGLQRQKEELEREKEREMETMGDDRLTKWKK